MLVANHCWKGFATKYPSAVKKVVKGASISLSTGVLVAELVTVTARK